MPLPFPFTATAWFLLQWMKRRFCSDERLQRLAHILSLSTFCSIMHSSRARFSFFFFFLVVLFCFVFLRPSAATWVAAAKSDGFLSVLEKRVLAGRSGRTVGAGAVFCSACPGSLSVGTEWRGPARADRGKPFWECGQTSRPWVPAAKKKKRADTESLHTVALLCRAAEILWIILICLWPRLRILF